MRNTSFLTLHSCSFVGQNGVDAESLTHLKGEIKRLFINERRRRVELWINGTVKSSLMLPRINPNFIGSEEVAVQHCKFPSFVLVASFCFF
jgi:hypothetical protein